MTQLYGSNKCVNAYCNQSTKSSFQSDFRESGEVSRQFIKTNCTKSWSQVALHPLLPFPAQCWFFIQSPAVSPAPTFASDIA